MEYTKDYNLLNKITKLYKKNMKMNDIIKLIEIPINDFINNERYEKYQNEASKEKNLIIGGRLGSYKYFDMDKTILNALEICEKELEGKRV